AVAGGGFCVKYFRMAARGSLTTRMLESKISVARVAVSYLGQCGMCSLSGFPLLANAIQAEASACATFRPSFRPDPHMFWRYRLNDASTSWPCTAPNLPSKLGFAHSHKYMYAPAPP